MSLDDAEHAAYESLDSESLEVWSAWIAGDPDAAERLDVLDDEQRTLTMTALGLEPFLAPSVQNGKLTVAPRHSTQMGTGAGEKLIRHFQEVLDRSPSTTRFPPTTSSTPAQSTPLDPTRHQRNGPRARSNIAAVVAWVLIIVGIVSVAIAPIFGRDSVDMGFGISLSAQEPWAQPLTWGGAALSVIGIAVLLTRNRTGSSTAE